MAIVQVSRITNRKGLTENLPQLAGAEFGWCIDSRRLFIGNGTLQDGAPVIGNTEILTEFSDVTALSLYTYKDIAVGYAAQTGPTPSEPVVRTVQAKLDDFADVRDFGATGDGTTDDTAAINRALFQLYCRDNNTAVRRTLYFPAGTYRVTDSIVIPTYAKLVGEGADCTIIALNSEDSTFPGYVAQYGDSLQQTGVNIGNNGATTPRNIEISSMTFQSLVISDIFLVASAEQCYFDSVNFIGPFASSDITDPGFQPATVDNVAGVRISSTDIDTTNTITFDKCRFSGTAYGIKTDAICEAITVSNSKLDTLYQGIVLEGTLSSTPGIFEGPTGFRAVHNMFDVIYAEGIFFDNVSLNISAYNIFYNVGSSIGSSTPTDPVVRFTTDNNVSLNDMFERDDGQAQFQPRVQVTSTSRSIGGTLVQLGRYARENGLTYELQSSQTNATVFSFNSYQIRAISVDYTIVRDTLVRHGRMVIVPGPDDSSAQIQYTDDYTETGDTGITLSAAETASVISLNYSSTAGSVGIMTYSVTHLA